MTLSTRLPDMTETAEVIKVTVLCASDEDPQDKRCC